MTIQAFTAFLSESAVEFGDLATWAGAAFSLLTGIVAAVLSVQLSNRERRLALVELHQGLTSGEIAAARNTMGTLLYSDADASPDRLEAIEAYFRLMWALQRARNVFRVHKMYWKTLTGPTTRREKIQLGRRHKEAALALTWNLNEIAENVVVFHDMYGDAWGVSDGDAWNDVVEFIDLGAVRASRGGPAETPLLGSDATAASMAVPK